MDNQFVRWIIGILISVGGVMAGYLFARKKNNAETNKISIESGKILEETESLKIFNSKHTLEIHKIVVEELKSYLEIFVIKCRQLSIENDVCEEKRKKLEEIIRILEQKNNI